MSELVYNKYKSQMKPNGHIILIVYFKQVQQ